MNCGRPCSRGLLELPRGRQPSYFDGDRYARPISLKPSEYMLRVRALPPSHLSHALDDCIAKPSRKPASGPALVSPISTAPGANFVSSSPSPKRRPAGVTRYLKIPRSLDDMQHVLLGRTFPLRRQSYRLVRTSAVPVRVRAHMRAY